MIEVENVTKYYGQHAALQSLTFHVKRGEILGFLGPNGAGKTTTMKILTSFINPTEGVARVAGHDVVKDSMAVRKLVGYLPENAPLYHDMVVADYLKYVSEIRRIPREKRHRRLLEVVDVCGLTTVFHRPIGELSKGFRQRVGLAQALIHEPEILILDEPTSGLDPNQIVEIRDLIKKIGQEKTVVLSTHILPEVEATCNRVVIVNSGRIVADGAMDELRNKNASDTVHVKVTASEPKPAVFKNVLAAIPGVKRVEEARGEAAHVFGFQLLTDKGHDVRKTVFNTAVENNWTLMEMRREELDLEAIFRTLTTTN